MAHFTPTPDTTLHRHPERAVYDREQVYAILDEALVCHVGFVANGRPMVLPTTHARRGDELLIHGAAGGRMPKTLAGGIECCITVTLLDGLVLARSAFHHSVNFRSVVVLGTATEILDPAEKHDAFRALIEHVAPGRWPALRPVKDGEAEVTTILSLSLTEASAKVRTGPPKDPEGDLALDIWGGVLPLRLVAGEPEPDPRLPRALPVPRHVAAWTRP